MGEPIGIVVADSLEIAKKIATKIEIEYKELPAVFDPRDAFEKGKLIMPPRYFHSVIWMNPGINVILL